MSFFKISKQEINEDEDDDDIITDDEWEDSAFPDSVKDKYPGFHLLKITNYNSAKLQEIKEWGNANISHGSWEIVGWYSYCAYSVGVVIENREDAMLFKLRWY